jgi:hypothetical protein
MSVVALAVAAEKENRLLKQPPKIVTNLICTIFMNNSL